MQLLRGAVLVIVCRRPSIVCTAWSRGSVHHVSVSVVALKNKKRPRGRRSLSRRRGSSPGKRLRCLGRCTSSGGAGGNWGGWWCGGWGMQWRRRLTWQSMVVMVLTVPPLSCQRCSRQEHAHSRSQASVHRPQIVITAHSTAVWSRPAVHVVLGAVDWAGCG